VEVALNSWLQDYSSLRARVFTLWSSVVSLGPSYQSSCKQWQRAAELRNAIQARQTEDCLQVSRDLENEIARFVSQMSESCEELSDLGNASCDALRDVHALTDGILEQRQRSCDDARREYEQASGAMEVATVALKDIRQQVLREAQALQDEAVGFRAKVEHVFAWRATLVEQLQLLRRCRSELRLVVQLQRQLNASLQERISSEDDFDAAQTDLRKHKRHAQCSSQCCVISEFSKVAAGAAECRYERRVTEAGKRLQILTAQVEQERGRLRKAEAALPFTLLPASEPEQTSPTQWHFWPEGRLAWKLAEVEQRHADIEMHVAILQAERDEALLKATKGSNKGSAEFLVEADLMCPITHEIMREPVLAADAHTYERAAIEKWMQTSNTSPMTGAALAHRFLTQNFALRRIIESYEACVDQSECASSDTASVASLVVD
jgi:hypothetical protein